ncbi:MAG: transglycosylase domain-containing protein, partial [Bacteroidales bacterium]|nr:transglycosylase domain-containing protein [Bacteroidales bacterium]
MVGVKKEKESYTPKTKKAIFITLWCLCLIMVAGLATYFIVLSNGKDMPTFKELENPNENLATRIYSSDDQLLGTYFRENRSYVPYDSISQNVIDALIATEDVRFYDHCGVDFKSLPRVFKGIVTGNSAKGGGSTISQQLAKMLFPREKMSKIQFVNRKFKEWIIATKLENQYTKEEIISMYLNKFDFLNLAVGIESASRIYFDTIPLGLTKTQAAMLVGMAQNPSLYNPIRYPERALSRRNTVLSQMLKYDKITRAEYDSLVNEPLGINFRRADHNLGAATYFREFLRLWLTAKKPIKDNYVDVREYIEDSINWEIDPSYGWCNKNKKPDGSSYDIYSDGLQLYTTIDSRMQKYAEEAVAEHVGAYLQPEFTKSMANNKNAPYYSSIAASKKEECINSAMRRTERWRVLKKAGVSEEDIVKTFYVKDTMTVFSWNGDIDTVMTPMDSMMYYKGFLQAGFLSMEPKTGHVKAYVGGINYMHFKYDNATKSRRQVGSTFKPFIYCLLMQNGYSPCTKVPNVEQTFKLPTGQYYTPRYSKSKLDGQTITLKQGLAGSLNQISAWALKQTTPEAVVDLANKMGVHSQIEPFPSMCVGIPQVLLCEMVGAYCTYPNKGIYTRPIYITRIEDKDGNELASFIPIQTEAISEETAALMIELLRGVVDMGTGSRLRFKYNLTGEMGGKTGTTNNNSDAWFMGVTPNLVNGVWVGGEEPTIRFSNMAFGQGASAALPIWALYMQKVYADRKLNKKYSPDDKFPMPEGIK